MSDNIFLKPTATSPWKWDNTGSFWYLEIAGSTVAQIDSNGNLRIPGRVLKIT